MKKLLLYIAPISLLFAYSSCTKDKVPIPPPVEQTKWEKICGDYKVYDSLSNYLYEMTISHSDTILSNGTQIDSLHFENYGNLFNLTKYQTVAINIPEGYVDIGSNNPIEDKFGNRWNLWQATDFDYNVLKGDTITLRYRRVNILYYIQDLVPYCDTTIIEVAVKQH